MSQDRANGYLANDSQMVHELYGKILESQDVQDLHAVTSPADLLESKRTKFLEACSDDASKDFIADLSDKKLAELEELEDEAIIDEKYIKENIDEKYAVEVVEEKETVEEGKVPNPTEQESEQLADLLEGYIVLDQSKSDIIKENKAPKVFESEDAANAYIKEHKIESFRVLSLKGKVQEATTGVPAQAGTEDATKAKSVDAVKTGEKGTDGEAAITTTDNAGKPVEQTPATTAAKDAAKDGNQDKPEVSQREPLSDSKVVEMAERFTLVDYLKEQKNSRELTARENHFIEMTEKFSCSDEDLVRIEEAKKAVE